MPIAEIMRAWVLGDPNKLKLVEKPVPVPGRAEILVRVDAVRRFLRRLCRADRTRSRSPHEGRARGQVRGLYRKRMTAAQSWPR
jgi:hypothetical protein